MNRNRLPNRYSLPLKSAAIAVGPSGLLPVHGFPAADPPTLPKAATANAAAGVVATTAAVRAPGIHKTPRMFTRTCAPSLWCCGVVVGVIFCLMNRQVNAAPVGETSIERRFIRSIADQILDQLEHDHEQMVADGVPGVRAKRNLIESNLESGVSEGAGARRKRTTGSIMAELKEMWEQEQVKDGKPVAGVRTRRTAATILDEIENRLNQPEQPMAATSVRGKRSACSEPESEAAAAEVAEEAEAKRSFADQRLADFLVRQRLFKLKPESALRGEGGGVEELEDSFDVNLFGKE